MSLSKLRESDRKPIQARIDIEDSPLRTLMRKAIWETNLSYHEIGRRAGVSFSTVSYLMNGKREGRIETWETILDALGIELGYRVKEEV